MNESGEFLSPLAFYFDCSADNAIVVHDEIAFPLGEVKISRNKGAGDVTMAKSA